MFKGIYHLLIQNTICCQYFWCTGVSLVIVICGSHFTAAAEPQIHPSVGGTWGGLPSSPAPLSDRAVAAVSTRKNSLISSPARSFQPLWALAPSHVLSSEQLPGQQRLWGRFNCDLMSNQNKALVPFCVYSRSPNKCQCAYFIRLRWLAIFFSQYERGKGGDSPYCKGSGSKQWL